MGIDAQRFSWHLDRMGFAQTGPLPYCGQYSSAMVRLLARLRRWWDRREAGRAVELHGDEATGRQGNMKSWLY